MKHRGISAGVGGIVVLVSALAGCAGLSPEERAELAWIAAEPIICLKGDDCDEKWGRAVTWVSRNSQFRIQLQTDNLIQTYIAPGVVGGFVVNKEPLGNSRFQIAFNSGCTNGYGCAPDSMAVKANFNRYVLGLSGLPGEGRGQALGVTLATVTPTLATLTKMGESRGVMVISVARDSAAARFGLREGDVILKYGERVINAAPDLQVALASTAPGTAVPMTIWRQGKEVLLFVAL